jgi:hypothetical protein
MCCVEYIVALKKVFASIDEGLMYLPGTNAQDIDFDDMKDALEMIGIHIICILICIHL